MQVHSFQPGIERSHATLLHLRGALCGIIGNPEERNAVEEAIEELATTLEELRVADEELRAQNEELAASREMTDAERGRYLELFQSAPMAYLVTDTAALIQEANRAAEVLLQYPAGGLERKPLALFFHARDTQNLSDQMARARTERESRAWNSWLHTRGRPDPVPVSIMLVPIEDKRASQVAGFRLVMRDLTEMMANKDRVRDLEDGLWRRVAERTARLTEEVERLRLTVSRYVDRYGALPTEHPKPPQPFVEPKGGQESAAHDAPPPRRGEHDEPGTRRTPGR